jgi:hypothetical protein
MMRGLISLRPATFAPSAIKIESELNSRELARCRRGYQRKRAACTQGGLNLDREAARQRGRELSFRLVLLSSVVVLTLALLVGLLGS